MLTQLHIKDFTLVDQLDLELHCGLTTITGETGAGKSIMLDALSLAIGDRADGAKIRQNKERAEIHASFDVSELPHVQAWLKDKDLGDGDECIFRRVITRDGRSRAYVNGKTVPLQQMRALGEQLIDIHNQHEHQSLLKPQTHRRLIDDFGEAKKLGESVKKSFSQWLEIDSKLDQARSQSDEVSARFQLLSYQVQELDQLSLEEGEVAALEKEQKILANADKLQEHCQNVTDICDSDGVGLKDRLNHAVRLLNEIPDKPEQLQDIETLFNSALINVEEAQADIERFLDSAEADPSRLNEIELRLNVVYEIARKHRIDPEALTELHQQLQEELSGLQSGDDLIKSLEEQRDLLLAAYTSHADKLSKKRRKAATQLSQHVNRKLSELAMEHAKFTVQLESNNGSPTRHGNEDVAFLISTIPGQPPQALSKVASGGELSRISLAIQVVTAQTSTTPTMVFDEVDVGIGGTTGDVVGEMLRSLGASGQVFCVTHLAQVASKSHHHLRIEKSVNKKGATSVLTALEGDEKIIEIARMMGGAVDSKQSLEHAKAMISET